MESIRKNNAPIGGVFGWGDDSVGSDVPFNRGGFRDFGDVGAPAFLPNGDYISYKDVDLKLPKGVANLLGVGGGKKGSDKATDKAYELLEIDLTNPRPTTPYPSPLANDPAARQLRPFQSGYMTDSPDTLDFFDTEMGKSGAGQWYKRNKGFVDPAVKGILTSLFLGPAAGLSTAARGFHSTLVKGSTPGSGGYDSRIDARTPVGFDRYAGSPWASILPRMISVVK